MKKILSLITTLLCFHAQARAALEPLQFSARISNERLAEEAIELLHCLSEKMETPWELGEDKNATSRLNLREIEGRLEGELLLPGQEKKAIKLSPGEAQSLCRSLFPHDSLELISKEEVIEEDFPEEPKPFRNKWLLLGASAALLAGGFLLWKRQSPKPDHSSLRME